MRENGRCHTTVSPRLQGGDTSHAKAPHTTWPVSMTRTWWVPRSGPRVASGPPRLQCPIQPTAPVERGPSSDTYICGKCFAVVVESDDGED